ncbi:discoidin domain-containing protein [Streptomyces sp. MNU76]|uniref:discoidin domain-containing protein n=1 Tax=Streptomyces sp. MNU76 TaxID=2560026 RepID=UPI0035A99892
MAARRPADGPPPVTRRSSRACFGSPFVARRAALRRPVRALGAPDERPRTGCTWPFVRCGGGGTSRSSASRDRGRAANAIDGDINTKWSLGHGTTSGDWFQIDLGSPTSFNKIVFDTGVNNSFDYVTKYQIYVSDDGAEWGSAIASGSGGNRENNRRTADPHGTVPSHRQHRGLRLLVGHRRHRGVRGRARNRLHRGSDSGGERPPVEELDQQARGPGHRGLQRDR